MKMLTIQSEPRKKGHSAGHDQNIVPNGQVRIQQNVNDDNAQKHPGLRKSDILCFGKQVHNILILASWLEENPEAEFVRFHGFSDHACQQNKSIGLSFSLKENTIEAAAKLIRNTRQFDETGANTLKHLASTSYAGVPAYVRRRAGVRDSHLWLTVDECNINQLLTDLEVAFGSFKNGYV
ncbi:MAG: PLP-dependent transferase [Cyclobacteriaceae bacterium]|nr:PLP-dependent transferase [Cyclobacteriaceae bacterium]